jgi:hypothetical protein
MATYTSYDVVGKKEDVSDIIENIDPTEVPFTTSIGAPQTVDNTTFQWQEDVIRAPASNAQLEGFTASANTRTPTTIRNNVTQILQETYEVSGTNEQVAKYGRGKESAYQAALTASALKLDLEYAFVGSAQAKVTPSDNSTARVMAGYQAQIDSSVRVATGGTSTVPTEANLLTCLSALFSAGAKPKVIQVTPTNSLTFADFAKATGRQREIENGTEDRTIVNVVEIYVSPFGRQKVTVSRELHSKWTLVYDPEKWTKAVLKGRNWFREKLAKVGDKDTYMMVGEFSLKHGHTKASGGIEMAAS